MTDFLDRLVARVLPGQGGQAVVRTRPRSRFEQGAPAGVLEQREEGSASPGGVQDGSMGEGPHPDAPVGSPRGGGESTASTVSPRGLRNPAPAAAPAGVGPGGREGAVSRDTGVLRQRDQGRGRPGGELSALVGPSGERARGPAEEGAGVMDPAAVLRPVPRRSVQVGEEGDDGGALALETRGGDSAQDPGSRSRSQPRGLEVPSAPVDPGSPAPVLRRRPSPEVPGSPTSGVPGAGDVRGAREGASGPEQPTVVHLRPAPRPRGPEAAPELAPVQLRIGRVEIRGSEPTPTHRRTPLPPPQPRSPALDLAEYLRRRNLGRRP